MIPRSILTDCGETACCTKANVNDSAEADGRSASQSALIYSYLALFPANIAAVETYEHFCRYAQSLSSGLRSKSRIVAFLEKFVLWAICIARKPLDEFTASDIRDFSAFCAEPPESWIGTRKARFVTNAGAECHGGDWKPFGQSITDPELGYVINRFFKFLSPELGTQPRLSRSDLFRAPRAPFSELDDSRALKYLQYLANLLPCTKVSERSLFVFSVCYHLRLSFKEWRSERSLLSMACFSSIDSSNPCFIMRGHLRDYQIPVHQALVDEIYRYRRSLGLTAVPSPEEIDPILTQALLNKVMCRLPIMSGLDCSPSVLLDRALGFHRSGVDPSAPATSKSESSRQYRLGWKRKQLSMPRKDVHQQAHADQDVGYHLQECPPPLFGMRHREVFVLSKPQAQAYAKNCFPKSLFNIAVESFEILRIYRSCSADRLKLVALEKLLLWSIYVKGKSLYSLTAFDAYEFYAFCLAPPASWIGSYARARLDAGAMGVQPNPSWTPFVHIPGGDQERGLRAARIMDWCDNVCNSLLVMESININIFSGLTD
ncbi:hypothetical protein JFT58_20430 [Pseudomonas sp. MF6767]|uniref:hypothetical protein n=1 Tax=Pseudomonas sp. MF6767 TaxID=2797531 RepID=UPI0018E86D8E|nr:hypothetical protein [Pseudomonas sp. MF6767]MBJ2280649.1 hypothetical protein [Pseudomonas sp. MF6767]